MPDSLLIENGTVLTLGKTSRVLHGHSVLIENGLVAKVAPKKAIKHFRGKRINATGKVVLPGFINAHTHFYSSFARGLTKAKPSKNFNRSAQESLVAAGFRADDGRLLLQRADRVARLDSSRHDDAD